MRNQIIQPAALREFHHEEVFNYAECVAKAFQPMQLAEMQGVYGLFLASLNDFRQKLEPIRQRTTPQNLIAKDRERTTSFRALRHQINGYLYSTETEEVEAAIDLTDVVRKFNTIPTQNYRKKSGSLRNFLDELQTNYINQLQTLRLTPRIELLHNQNEQFDQLFQRRNEEERRCATWLEVREARKLLIANYRTLVSHFEAVVGMQIYTDDPQIIAQPINEALGHWNTILAKRRTANKKKRHKKQLKKQTQKQ